MRVTTLWRQKVKIVLSEIVLLFQTGRLDYFTSTVNSGANTISKSRNTASGVTLS